MGALTLPVRSLAAPSWGLEFPADELQAAATRAPVSTTKRTNEIGNAVFLSMLLASLCRREVQATGDLGCLRKLRLLELDVQVLGWNYGAVG
jgi:hypothetical protein